MGTPSAAVYLSSVTVCAGITEGTGTLYVSGAQLKQETLQNKLNLITNPGFELGKAQVSRTAGIMQEM